MKRATQKVGLFLKAFKKDMTVHSLYNIGLPMYDSMREA